MTRGGARQGKPGASYGQRTDLNTKPIRTGPVAVSAPAAPLTESPGGGAPPVAGGTSPSQTAFAPHPNPPGAAGSFNRATERPSEPLTHGMPFGPGAGPEVLSNMAPQLNTMHDLLSAAANMPGASPDLSYLASLVAQGQP